MTTWAERLLTCIHGIKEGLDSHDCPVCIRTCNFLGHKHMPRQNCIYLKPVKKHNKDTVITAVPKSQTNTKQQKKKIRKEAKRVSSI